MAERHGIPWYNRIQLKLSSIIIALTVLTIVVSGAYNIAVLSQQKRAELENLAANTATRLAEHLTLPMWVVDETQVENSMVSEFLDPHVAAILVRDEDGETLLRGRQRAPSGEVIAADANFAAGDLLVATADIERDGESIGRVEVYVTQRFLRQELIDAGIDEGIQLLLLTGLLALAISIALRNLLIRPVTHLTEAAADISRGNLDVSLEAKSNDEIGQLTSAFERMRLSLKVAMDNMTAR